MASSAPYEPPAGTPEKGASGPYDGKTPGQYWTEQLEASERWFKMWQEDGMKILRRYRDERDMVNRTRRRFNILWSNTQIMKPALYGREAMPDVSRRHDDQDPVGRVASMMLQRTIGYETEHFPDFSQAMNGAVDDRLLPGRGIAWVRYEPEIVSMEPDSGEESGEAQISEDVDRAESAEAQISERVVSVRSPTDYVHWQDFLHSPARTWEEVWWVSRWVYMTLDEGTKRFGSVFVNVPRSYDATTNERDENRKITAPTYDKKAKVAEIWNIRTGQVCWLAKGWPQILDERADPLELDEFFPCPRPLYASTTTDSLIPIADYMEYRDQAEELDNLTQRISVVTRAIKTNGVYNAEFKSIKRLLNEGVDNLLEPVDNWAAFAEKQGLRGALQLIDTDPMIKALAQLYIARDQAKQTIYEIYGISDIIRGSSNANETLGAQQLKANFGSMRLRSSQSEVARFASDLFKLKAQIVCKFYPPELIREMSGIGHTLDGQNEQLVQEALALLKNSTLRDWRISVESDSLAQLDEQQDRQEALECVKAVGGLLEKGLPMVQVAPGLMPIIEGLTSFVMRKYRTASGLESTFEQAFRAIQQQAEQARANPPPDPAMEIEKMKAQAEQQKAQMGVQKEMIGLQVKKQEAQIDQTMMQAQLQQDAQKLMMDGERMQMEYERDKARAALPAPERRQ